MTAMRCRVSVERWVWTASFSSLTMLRRYEQPLCPCADGELAEMANMCPATHSGQTGHQEYALGAALIFRHLNTMPEPQIRTLGKRKGYFLTHLARRFRI